MNEYNTKRDYLTEYSTYDKYRGQFNTENIRELTKTPVNNRHFYTENGLQVSVKATSEDIG
jgi:predicted ATPase